MACPIHNSDFKLKNARNKKMFFNNKYMNNECQCQKIKYLLDLSACIIQWVGMNAQVSFNLI